MTSVLHGWRNGAQSVVNAKKPKPLRDQNPKKCVREESHPATEHWALASVTDWKRATAQCPQVRHNRPKRKEGGVSGHKKPSPVSACSVEHSGFALVFTLDCCSSCFTLVFVGFTGTSVVLNQSLRQVLTWKLATKFLADLCYLTCMCHKCTFENICIYTILSEIFDFVKQWVQISMVHVLLQTCRSAAILICIYCLTRSNVGLSRYFKKPLFTRDLLSVSFTACAGWLQGAGGGAVLGAAIMRLWPSIWRKHLQLTVCRHYITSYVWVKWFDFVLFRLSSQLCLNTARNNTKNIQITCKLATKCTWA